MSSISSIFTNTHVHGLSGTETEVQINVQLWADYLSLVVLNTVDKILGKAIWFFFLHSWPDFLPFSRKSCLLFVWSILMFHKSMSGLGFLLYPQPHLLGYKQGLFRSDY